MNGFLVMAESYKKLMEQGKIEKEVAEKEMRIYEFWLLATVTICTEYKVTFNY